MLKTQYKLIISCLYIKGKLIILCYNWYSIKTGKITGNSVVDLLKGRPCHFNLGVLD
ncbi:hypothetical protein LPICM02_190003 [Pseudolactococcus piscium]|nr:hypothetical protein LPICM02_190003 [Lactococcus piscium]